MSNLQEHQAEQDALTAQCEAGTCGHAECNAPDPIAAAYREEARATYADDEIQIDADARVSIADDGAWVAAWVWVRSD